MDNLCDFINPCDNFYDYVNHNWISNNNIPNNNSKWDEYEILYYNNMKKLLDLIKNSNGYYSKLKLIYDKFMNVKNTKNDNLESLTKYFKLIDNCISRTDLWKIYTLINQKGLNIFFIFSITEDFRNNNLIVPQLKTSGLGLFEKDYYFKEDETVVNEYKNLIYRLLEMSDNTKNYETIVEEIFKIETKLANKTFSLQEKKTYLLNYNILSVQELEKICNLDWNYFFKTILNKQDIKYLIVDNPQFYSTIYDIWMNTDLNILKIYIKYHIIKTNCNFLGEEYFDIFFNFYGKYIWNIYKPKPRWEYCIEVINTYLGELLGRLFVENYFDCKTKLKVLNMIIRLNKHLRIKIINLPWMSEETKKNALLKNDNFKVDIGHPDSWKDYSNLFLDDSLSLIDLIIKCHEYNFNYQIKKLYTFPDENKWNILPHSINGYYDVTNNKIVFSAGLLQKPFFDPDADDEINYGAIGVLIAHEMIHLYNEVGSNFNYKGELSNWWTKSDKEKYYKISEYYIKRYNKCEINKISVNGLLTLTKNLADIGGIKIAFHTLQEIFDESNISLKDKIKKNKIFFLTWAKILRCIYKNEKIIEYMQDVLYTISVFRVNETLANISEFQKTFGVKSDHKMFRKAPNIW